MSDLSTTMENLKKIGEIAQKQVEEMNKTLRPVIEAIAKVQKTTLEIAKIFEKTIYLSPETYKFLLTLNVQISQKEIDRQIAEGILTEEDIYTVYTVDSLDKKVRSSTFNVPRDVAKAIRLIVKNRPQYMFLETEKIVFNDEEPSLTINGYKIILKRGTYRFELCKYMFGGKKPKKMPWELEDLVKAIGEDYYSGDQDWYEVIYRKYRALNDLIRDSIGYEKFFVVKDKRFSVNPVYVYLLKS